MDRVEKARELHKKGYSCSQAVLCAFSEAIGVEEQILFKVTEGLGYGMGDSHGVCGAVVGASIVCGLKNSSGNLASPTESRQATMELAKKIKRDFQAKNGSVICKELLEQKGNARHSCRECVADATELAEKYCGD